MDNKINFKKISSKILTLSYPKYRFFIFVSVLFLLAILPISIVAKTHDASICSKVLGKYCYSVGITRGVSSLLKGDFSEAISFNWLSIPVLIILIFFIFHDFWKAFIKR
jgi:hypothetical protein